MALLTLSNILSNERLDLPDFNNIEEFVAEDFSAIFQNLFSGTTQVVRGFRVFQDLACTNDNPSASPVYIKLDGSAVIHTEAVGTPMFYAGASGLAASQVNLVANAVNYVEMELTVTTGSPDTRSFWDPSANAGAGAEFTQIVDTARNLTATFSVNNVGFTGGNKLPIAQITLTGAAITGNVDKRNLLFRLGVGQPVDASHVYAWPNGQVEVSADRAVSALAYLSADKAITTFKEWMDAVMTEMKRVKGTSFWHEIGVGSITGINNFVNSLITQNSAGARFSWSGAVLSITDDNGAPADADVVGKIRFWTQSTDLNLTREDGTGGSSTIAIADGQVLFVQLPTSGNRTYSGSGVGSTNYQVVARGSFVANDVNYWLAFREGAKVYVRGLGELEAGESAQISDTINENILTAIGLASETSMPSYVSTSSGSLNLPDYNAVATEAVVARVAKITAMLADIKQDANITFDPGVVTWTGANITITGASLSIPGTGVGAAAVSINTYGPSALADGDCLYVDISRTLGTALTLSSSALTALTPVQQRLVIARRIGSDIITK